MKLTVSSTSMMKPILCIDDNASVISPPQRVLGLLECTGLEDEQHKSTRKLLQFHRPDKQQALLQTANWRQFLQLKNKKSNSCAAVFGFEFDGKQVWYQLWNTHTQRTCWLTHSDDMNYEPFAILAMDALTSLLSHWDGALHQSPFLPHITMAADAQATTLIESNKVHNLLVSDASTSKAGNLWFLVTVNTTTTGASLIDGEALTHSGWIT